MRVQPFDFRYFPQLQAFLRRQYPYAPAKADERYFRWKFEQNPVASSLGNYFLAINGDDQVVGQVAAVGDKLWLDGEWHPFVWLADFAVTPEHRGTHIGLRLLQSVMSVNRLLMVVGCSTVLYDIYRALGWKKHPAAEMFFSIIHPSRLATLAGRRWDRLRPLLNLGDRALPALQSLRGGLGRMRPSSCLIEPLPRFDVEVDALIERLLLKLGITCYRSAEQLAWKFDSRPVGSHFTIAARDKSSRELRGYLVVRLLERDSARWAEVGDVVADPSDQDAFPALLSAAHRRALDWNVDFVRFWCSRPEFIARLRAPFWLRHTRPIVDDLLIYSRDSGLVQRITSRPWHLTAMASDRIDDGSGQWRFACETQQQCALAG